VRTYDNADRVTLIQHKAADNTLLLGIYYYYNRDNTVYMRVEYDATGQTPHTAVVEFGYDARKRLITESRELDESTTVYALAYAYDQLGNRRTKTDYVGDRVTGYVYDTDWDPVEEEWSGDAAYTPTWTPEYVTRNNRLLEYKVWGPEGSGGGLLGAWSGMAADHLARLALGAVRYRRGAWKHIKV